MLGAIVGDIIGSSFEHNGVSGGDFVLFRTDNHYTENTLLTLMTARALLSGQGYALAYCQAFRAEPHHSWGMGVRQWCQSPSLTPCASFGNRAAARVSPVACFLEDETEVLHEAARTAALTHKHPDAVKGVQAVALAVLLARRGVPRDSIRQRIKEAFGYDLDRSVQTLRETYHYNETCQGTVPEALICFLESEDFEDAIRNAVAINGDAATLAAITGSVAEAWYGGVPAAFEKEARRRLRPPLEATLDEFLRALNPGQASD